MGYISHRRDKIWGDEVEEMLNIFSLEEILEMNDLSPLEAVNHLISVGLITVPDYLESDMYDPEVNDDGA